MPRLLVIDDRDQTVQMCHRHLPQFDYVTRCNRSIPCQVCEERDRGCALQCAHDYHEAEEVLSKAEALPDLVILDLHFARPEERLLPEDKSHLPVEPKERKAAVEDLRRKQGLHILSRLRRDYPSLPVVMLTTTDAELGADRPGDPLVYFCENEVVDSRSLAAEITRALALGENQREGAVFWGRSPQMAELRRSIGVLARSPLPVLVEGETGTGKSFLAEHALHPRSGRRDRWWSPICRPSRRRCCRRTCSAPGGGRTPAPSKITPACSSRRTGARCSSTRSPTWIWICNGSCCWCWSGGRSPAWATASRGRRRPSWWRRPTRTWRRWSARGGFAATCTCG